jgi:hypothetical protein
MFWEEVSTYNDSAIQNTLYCVAVITVDTTAKINVLGYRDSIFTMIFNDRPMISFQVRKTDKAILMSFEVPRT